MCPENVMMLPLKFGVTVAVHLLVPLGNVRLMVADSTAPCTLAV